MSHILHSTPDCNRPVRLMRAVPDADKPAVHAEIADMYRRERHKRRGGGLSPNARLSIRMRELGELRQKRYGEHYSDDDAGRDSLEVYAHHLAHMSGRDPVKRIVSYASLRAPWMPAEEARALAMRVAKEPVKFSADALAERERVSWAERTALGMTTIGAFDLSKDERKRARDDRRNERKKAKRAENGSGRGRGRPARAGLAPWEVEGISKSTYHRRLRKAGASDTKNTATPIKGENGVAGINVSSVAVVRKDVRPSPETCAPCAHAHLVGSAASVVWPEVEPGTMLYFALDYARRGWPVLPLNPADKVPLVGCEQDAAGNKIEGTGGVKRASRDPRQIMQWWGRWPDAMIGGATGRASGVWVVDLDAPKRPGAPDGVAEWEKLKRERGGCPPTHAQASPSGGVHLFFRCDPARLVGCSPGTLKGRGIDVRGEGGYIVLAPSRRADGKGYEVAEALDCFTYAEAPQWLYAALARPVVSIAEQAERRFYSRKVGASASRVAGLVAYVASSMGTGRNEALYWAGREVGRMQDERALSAGDAAGVLNRLAGVAADVGLSGSEIAKTLRLRSWSSGGRQAA